MSIIHRARRLLPLAALAAATAFALPRDAAACGDYVPHEVRVREAVGAQLASMSTDELEALLARLQREAAIARARAEKQAKAAAAKRVRTASR